MKKLITLFIGFSLICTTSIQAQDLLKIDDITVINSEVNNVIIQINTADAGQLVSSRIIQSRVNKKAGYTSTLNADNTLLTLNFTHQFNENELYTLLQYSGVKLKDTAFKQLYNHINQ